MTKMTFAARAVSAFVDKMERSFSCLADYMTIAAVQEPNARGNMPWDSDLHYFLNNSLQSLHVAIYGNTTDMAPSTKSPTEMGDLGYKPVHKYARAQKAVDDYRAGHSYCDESTDRFDAEVAANDADWIRKTEWLELKTAELHFFLHEYEAKKELYSTLFDEVWTYKPYTVGEKKAAKEMTEAQKQAAERYRQRMANRNKGDVEDHTKAA